MTYWLFVENLEYFPIESTYIYIYYIRSCLFPAVNEDRELFLADVMTESPC